LLDCDERTLALVWRVGIPWRRLDPRRGWVLLEDATQTATTGETEEGTRQEKRA